MDKFLKGPRLRDILWFDKIGYGFGNMGYGIIFQVIGSYLVFYATAVINVPGSLVGLAISISVVWDGITDPVMGYISDRTSFKGFGRRHLYILVGTFGTALFNYLLWGISSSLPNHVKFLWILADLILIKTFATVYATPYTALGAELSCDYNERTTIQGIKMLFFLVGLFFAVVMGMLLFFRPTENFPVGQLNPGAYRNIGLTSSLLMVASGLACFITTRKYIPRLPGLKSASGKGKRNIIHIFTSFLESFKNREFKYVVLGYLFGNIASAVAATLGLHVFTYTFQMDNIGIALIIGTQFFVSIISQPVWVIISRKIDKRPSLLLGLTAAISGTIALFILVLLKDAVAGNYLYLLPVSVVVGFGTGGMFSLPLSMIADTIDVEEARTGKRAEGVYYGCQTLFYKVSQSIAIFVLGVLLDLVKFDSSLKVQPESTQTLLGIILTMGSIGAFVMAFICYNKYGLDRNKINLIQEQIIQQG